MTGILSIHLLLLLTACAPEPVQPLTDPNAPPLKEPVTYSDRVQLFDEKRYPLAVRLIPSLSADGQYFNETLKKVLQDQGIDCVLPGKPYDIQIRLDSAFQKLTPAPQCRMSHILTLSVTAPNGTRLLPVWSRKTEMTRAYSTEEKAKNKLLPRINANIAAWGKIDFRNNVAKNLRVSVVRFRLSHKLIELDQKRFEKEQIQILNRLRRIKGVADVRMIEASRKNKTASFRVLFRSDILHSKQINRCFSKTR